MDPVELERVARGGSPSPLTVADREAIGAARALVERIVSDGTVVYGVTTGFGDLSSVTISANDTAALQLNLVRSHAIGVGDPLPVDVVRGMLLLLANALAKGHSGVQLETVELLHAMLHQQVTPVVPKRGSVGASGDLAPLAHIAVVLVGEGEAFFGSDRLPGGEALARAGLRPVTLAAKEGLALINGTHLMAATGTLAIREARNVHAVAVVAAALSLEAFKGATTPFDDRIHALRRQPGQRAVAERLRTLLDGSAIVASHADCGRVQDPYTLRCIPQVLGAIADALDYVEAVIERELDAVTDNPLLFPADGDAQSGGNFHGQPLSLVLDHLSIALAELAGFSERRTYALLSPSYADLPRFLTPRPGLSSGLMIAQYTQASLVNECQVLSHPAGVGSLPTSAGMEDWNSMGALAARKAREIVELASQVVAIELICAAQGVEFHRPIQTTETLEATIAGVRQTVPALGDDRSLSAEIEQLAERVRLGELL